MMTIVIVGAGDVGCYLASVLAKQEHNIILIDHNKHALERAALLTDVATKYGSGTDWQLLDSLLEISPDFFISLTPDDETNLVACSIAKNLGYPRTIARVKGNRYLNHTRLDFGRIFDVDHFIGPELLVANDILKIIISSGSLALESFAHGAAQMRTITIPSSWEDKDTPLRDLELPNDVMIGLVYRQFPGPTKGIAEAPPQLIFPHGDTLLLPGDEITLMGEKNAVLNVHTYFGVLQKKVSSAILVGGSLTAWNLATLLKNQHIDVRIIDKDYERCSQLAEQLPDCIIMHHDAANFEFLLSEKVEDADVIVTCTGSDEVNILTAVLAKEAGCKEAIVRLSNTSYLPTIDNLDLKHVVSARLSAANQILSHLFSGKVSSLVSLYENQVEILELQVSLNSKIAGIPLSDLGPLLPRDLLIAIIQNRGRLMVAHGDRIVSPGDSVIVITNPKHAAALEKIF